MILRARRWGHLAGLLAMLALLFPSPGEARTSQSTRAPLFDHIFVIVEENAEFDGIIGSPQAPTLNEMATRWGLATQYFGATHVSEGNYVALVGGDSYGITDDQPYTVHTVDQPSLVEQLEAANLTWKGYFQSMPVPGYAGTCYPNNDVCLYASKHNGFVNFAHVQGSSEEMNNLVPDTQLAVDLTTGTAPNFAFIVPDQCHDLHGIDGTCTNDQLSKQTDEYLKATVDQIMGSDVWNRGQNAMVVTFDEGKSNLGCCGANPGGGQVVTIVVRNHQAGPLQDATPYNHYALVATIQEAFGLGCRLNGAAVGLTCNSDSGVNLMTPLFDLRPASQ
jgi:phosphatidylinositol-3-phosphatase